MFVEALFIIVKLEKKPNVLPQKNGSTVLYPFNGILLSNKKAWTIDTLNNLDEFQSHYAEWKKSISKGYKQN